MSVRVARQVRNLDRLSSQALYQSTFNSPSPSQGICRAIPQGRSRRKRHSSRARVQSLLPHSCWQTRSSGVRWFGFFQPRKCETRPQAVKTETPNQSADKIDATGRETRPPTNDLSQECKRDRLLVQPQQFGVRKRKWKHRQLTAQREREGDIQFLLDRVLRLAHLELAGPVVEQMLAIGQV